MLSQAKLLSTSVLCVGAGGLGSTVIMYLAAAGVGELFLRAACARTYCSFVGHKCAARTDGGGCAFHLRAAGRLVIVDDDHVDTSNLHRQVIHTTASNGRPKALSARDAGRARLL